ncbi:hypothetical protein B0H14DRAFT_3653510 [Mycena olivaceomarginata]|nr:hypothetical protein B0H14DRAFT_3653510 [Mycena olivaceomarginata]
MPLPLPSRVRDPKMYPAPRNFGLRRSFHLITSRELSLCTYHRVHVRTIALLCSKLCSIHLHVTRCPSLPKICIQSICLRPLPSESRSKREIDSHPHYAVSAWGMGSPGADFVLPTGVDTYSIRGSRGEPSAISHARTQRSFRGRRSAASASSEAERTRYEKRRWRPLLLARAPSSTFRSFSDDECECVAQHWRSARRSGGWREYLSAPEPRNLRHIRLPSSFILLLTPPPSFVPMRLVPLASHPIAPIPVLRGGRARAYLYSSHRVPAPAFACRRSLRPILLVHVDAGTIVHTIFATNPSSPSISSFPSSLRPFSLDWSFFSSQSVTPPTSTSKIPFLPHPPLSSSDNFLLRPHLVASLPLHVLCELRIHRRRCPCLSQLPPPPSQRLSLLTVHSIYIPSSRFTAHCSSPIICRRHLLALRPSFIRASWCTPDPHVCDVFLLVSRALIVLTVASYLSSPSPSTPFLIHPSNQSI